MLLHVNCWSAQNVFVAVRYTLITAGYESTIVQSAAWPCKRPHMAVVRTALICNVGYSASVFVVFYMLLVWPETQFSYVSKICICSNRLLCGTSLLLDISASNKLFYRSSPACLFCCYTVHAPKYGHLVFSWKKRGKKCKGNRLQKHVGSTEKGREGRDWDVLTTESSS